MRAKFGRDPTAGSKKVTFKFISRCIHSQYPNKYQQIGDAATSQREHENDQQDSHRNIIFSSIVNMFKTRKP